MKRINLIFSVLTIGLLLLSGLTVSASGDMNGDIIFDHDLHVDLDCEGCHEKSLESVQSSDNLLPEMDYCGECHDIDDDENCGQCHRNVEEPGTALRTEREIRFNHKKHYELETDCSKCHSNLSNSSANHLPDKPDCMSCHDGEKAANDCALCHGDKQSLLDIHPLNWRKMHGYYAEERSKFCGSCHQDQSFCIDCHRGDNLTGTTHDLNYKFTHGLDASVNAHDCLSCHDNREFCNPCHENNLRIPLEHSTIDWLTTHGQKARDDVENCASCHDSADPTCARSGCHRDSDGLRGTDNRIHSDDITFFDLDGPWHNDGGYYCYQCHTNTNISGEGFCGYCHGSEDSGEE